MDTILQFLSRHPALKWILIANLVLFPIGFILGQNWCALGLVPTIFLHKFVSADLLGAFADLIRYQFFHASLSHIFFNMVFLFTAGMSLACVLGTRWFLGLYFAGGMISGLGLIVAAPLFTTEVPPDMLVHACFPAPGSALQMVLPMIGASGAVAGVMGAALALTSEQPIHHFDLFKPNFEFTLTLKHLLIAWVAWQVYLLFSAIGGHSIQYGEFVLHLSGFAFGYAAASRWARDRIKPQSH